MATINYTTKVDPVTGLVYLEWANIQKIAGVTVGDEAQAVSCNGLDFLSGYLKGTVSGAASMNWFADNAYDQAGVDFDPGNSVAQSLASLPVVFNPYVNGPMYRKVRFEGVSALVFDLTMTIVCRSV